jgi:ribokinase
MAAEIVVVGSANLDLVVDVARIPRPGETVLGGDLRRIPGGKGANQAVAAARLGRSVAMVGRVGDDEGGQILRAALDADGVNTLDLAETVDTPSGVALIAVAEDGDNAIVVSPGANGRVSVDDIDAAGRTIEAAACVLLQLEIPLPAVVSAAERARGTVILNPAPAPTVALPPNLIASVDVLVPNETELARLSGHEGGIDLETAATLARELPSPAVVVTLGASGALVVGDDEVHVPAPPVAPVDTTAAGDSFCAALADGIVSGRSLVEATEWAVRVGAATTLRAGAQPSLPTPAEVDELLATVAS